MSEPSRSTWHSKSFFIKSWSGLRMNHTSGGRPRWEVTQQEGIRTCIASTIEKKDILSSSVEYLRIIWSNW